MPGHNRASAVATPLNVALGDAIADATRRKMEWHLPLCLLLLIATLWMATRPYLGIVDDARLYAGQALHALLPGPFADDLYFRFGSQDSFTIFTRIYAPLIASIGLAQAGIVLIVMGQSLWVSGLGYLASGMLRGSPVATVVMAMASAILLPGGTFFRYGEQSLTPRLFAEALTLWALGAMLRRRPICSLVALLLAAAVHPLMTLPGLALFFVHEAIRRPIPWIGAAATGAVGGLTLGWIGIDPLSRIFARFDDAWFEVVRVRDYFCLIADWNIGEWFHTANALPLAAICIAAVRPPDRRLLWAALIVAAGGFLAALVGGDLMRNVLVVDVQSWRALWLLTVVTNLWIGSICVRILSRPRRQLDDADWFLVVAVALLAMSTFLPVLCFVSAPMAFVAWFARSWSSVGDRALMPRPARLVALAIAGFLLGCAVVIVWLTLSDLAQTPAGLTDVFGGVALSVAGLGVLYMLWKFNADTGRIRRMRAATLLASSVLAVASILTWDQRTPWAAFVETTEPPSSLVDKLPPSLSLYWEGDIRVPWFMLRRSSYFSCDQGSGVLFSRGTAISYQQRYDSFEPLRTLDFGLQLFCPANTADDFSRTPVKADDLSRVCKNEPDLGALVLTRRVQGVTGSEWTPKVRYEDPEVYTSRWKEFSTGTFFIYRCDSLRQ